MRIVDHYCRKPDDKVFLDAIQKHRQKKCIYRLAHRVAAIVMADLLKSEKKKKNASV